MFKRTRTFYLIWLIQIFSAINTRRVSGGGRGSYRCRGCQWLWTADGACEQLRQCQADSTGPLWALWPIYERRAVTTTVHLIYRRPAEDQPTGPAVAARIKRILTLLNARERSRLVPVFKLNDRFSFLSPRYFTSGNTIRHCPALSAVFAFLFPLDPLLFTCQFL